MHLDSSPRKKSGGTPNDKSGKYLMLAKFDWEDNKSDGSTPYLWFCAIICDSTKAIF